MTFHIDDIGSFCLEDVKREANGLANRIIDVVVGNAKANGPLFWLDKKICCLQLGEFYHVETAFSTFLLVRFVDLRTL